MKRFSWISFLTLACALFIHCSNHTSNTAVVDNLPVPKDKWVKDITGVSGGTLVLDITGNPQTFNPILSLDKTSHYVWDKIFLGLVSYNLETYTFEPELAKSFEVSSDGLTYTFHIREGARWSDGESLTAKDVLFTFKILAQEENAQARYSMQQTDGSLPVVTQIDAQTVQFKLKEINVLFLAAVGDVRILPEHKYGKAFADGQFAQVLKTNTLPQDIIGSGPFVIDTYVPDQRIAYKKNPYYFAFDKNGTRLPYYNKLVRIIVPDINTRYIKFENGETDMHELEVENYDRLKGKEKNGDFQIHDLGASLETTYFSCLQNPEMRADGVTPIMQPWKYKLFSDKRFRQALSYAVDRDSIVNTIFHGRGKALSSFSSPGNKTWYPQHLKTYRHDPEIAKSLLADAGLKDTDGDGFLEYEVGKKASFTIHTNSENNKRIQIGNIIKEDFKKVGLDVNLLPIPFNSLIDLTDGNLNYDCYIMGWTGATPPDPIMSKNVLLSSGALHDWHANQKTPQTPWEAEIDKYLQLNQNTVDEKKRVEYWHKIEEIWYDQQPQLMIAVPNKFVAIKNKIGNAKPSPYRPYYEWNLEDLYDKTLTPNP